MSFLSIFTSGASSYLTPCTGARSVGAAATVASGEEGVRAGRGAGQREASKAEVREARLCGGAAGADDGLGGGLGGGLLLLLGLWEG